MAKGIPIVFAVLKAQHDFITILLKDGDMDSMIWLSLLLAPLIIALFFLIGYLAYQRKSEDV